MYVAVEMKSHWIGAAPTSSGQCPYEAKKDPDTRGRSFVRTEQGGGACRRGRRRRPREAGRVLLWHRHPEARPVSTLGLNSGPDNCERTYFCTFKPPDLWLLFLQPQETMNLWPRGPRGLAVLTGGAPRHLDDALGLAAHLPGVEGADAHRHLHRGPGHLCGLCGSLLAAVGALASRGDTLGKRET